eukprot:Amastigsp_a509678_70.p4 type:complete len:101 gc:universal Amastigsp_a509678_70:861-1163(+)
MLGLCCSERRARGRMGRPLLRRAQRVEACVQLSHARPECAALDGALDCGHAPARRRHALGRRVRAPVLRLGVARPLRDAAARGVWTRGRRVVPLRWACGL